ncbi:MAG TPA: hypothetical protein VGB15_06600 [Longimicrobium sp.]|jgi:hypothetical protein
MRKVLIAAGALLFCATPAAAQQETVAPADQKAAPAREAAAAPEPAFFPTTDQVKEDVRQNEDRIGQEQAQIGSKSWWYLVAAVAIGVIVAAVVL